MHHVEQSVPPRVSDQDETVPMQAVAIVGAQLVVEGRGRFVEGNSVLLEIRRRLSCVPDEAHALLYDNRSVRFSAADQWPAHGKGLIAAVLYQPFATATRARLAATGREGGPAATTLLSDVPGYTEHYGQHRGWIEELVGR